MADINTISTLVLYKKIWVKPATRLDLSQFIEIKLPGLCRKSNYERFLCRVDENLSLLEYFTFPCGLILALCAAIFTHIQLPKVNFPRLIWGRYNFWLTYSECSKMWDAPSSSRRARGGVAGLNPNPWSPHVPAARNLQLSFITLNLNST